MTRQDGRRHLCEGRLVFDFSAALGAWRLDEPGRPVPYGMAFVDFVVQEKDRLLLVEVKDPAGAPAARRRQAVEAFREQVRKQKLIHEALVPKARDSYTYLHLMECDAKPCLYVVVLGLGGGDPALLLDFQDRLLKRLRREAAKPWKRRYVVGCVVVTPDRWNEFFGRYPLTVEGK